MGAGLHAQPPTHRNVLPRASNTTAKWVGGGTSSSRLSSVDRKPNRTVVSSPAGATARGAKGRRPQPAAAGSGGRCKQRVGGCSGCQRIDGHAGMRPQGDPFTCRVAQAVRLGECIVRAVEQRHGVCQYHAAARHVTGRGSGVAAAFESSAAMQPILNQPRRMQRAPCMPGGLTACRRAGAACRRRLRPWAAAAGPPAAAPRWPPRRAAPQQPATRAGGARCRACCRWACCCCCWAPCCCLRRCWPLRRRRCRPAAGREAALPPSLAPPVGPSRPLTPGARLLEPPPLSAALLDGQPWRRCAGAAAERGCDTQRPARQSRRPSTAAPNRPDCRVRPGSSRCGRALEGSLDRWLPSSGCQ